MRRVPTRSRDGLCFSTSTSSCVTVRTSSSGSSASVTTRAVISLVIEAIGSTACGFLLKSTSPVSWSTTSATLDFSDSGSGVARSPCFCPYDSTGGAARTVLRAVDFRVFFFTGAFFFFCAFCVVFAAVVVLAAVAAVTGAGAIIPPAPTASAVSAATNRTQCLIRPITPPQDPETDSRPSLEASNNTFKIRKL